MRLLEDGQMIRDTYEVERFLGEGAFAEVYRVKHRFLGRQAMKVTELDIDKKRLTNVAKREVLMPQIGASSGSKKERSRWN